MKNYQKVFERFYKNHRTLVLPDRILHRLIIFPLFIDDEGPRPNRLKEKYLQAVEVAELSSNNSSSSSSNKGRPKPLDESNLGSKMLQKMGWKEGLGLGKANQGRTSIIEVRTHHSEKKVYA